jgi:GTP-binding protein
MIIKEATLAVVCGPSSRLPETGQAEVAFAGKSNVGKSTLINTLLNRKALARTSAQPGKTQTINFYQVNQSFYLVDLPGYGYTTAAVSVRQSWGRMIERYLKRSDTLKNVFLLVDIRHEPNANDRQMYDWIVQMGYRPIVIATKADKINRSQISKQAAVCRKALGMQEDDLLIPFSAKTRDGRDQIWEIIEQHL